MKVIVKLVFSTRRRQARGTVNAAKVCDSSSVDSLTTAVQLPGVPAGPQDPVRHGGDRPRGGARVHLGQVRDQGGELIRYV